MSNYITGKNSRVLVTYGHEHVQDALRDAADQLDAYAVLKGEDAGSTVMAHLQLDDDDTWAFQVVVEETS